MAEHFLLSLSLSLIITEGFHARRAKIGNSTLQTLHSEGTFLEIKLFLTYSLLSRFCLKFVQVFFTWYLKGLGHAILGNFSTDQMVIESTKI